MGFPIYSYRKYRGEHCISLTPKEKPTKSYVNPLLLAFEYKAALEKPGIDSQADVARLYGISRARVNQYLKLLKLPEEMKGDIRNGKIKPTERGLRRILMDMKYLSQSRETCVGTRSDQLQESESRYQQPEYSSVEQVNALQLER